MNTEKKIAYGLRGHEAEFSFIQILCEQQCARAVTYFILQVSNSTFLKGTFVCKENFPRI